MKSNNIRINSQITSQEVLVVSEGRPPEKMNVRDAIRKAETAGLDLVEVSPDQKPPVCRIIDFGKWKYQKEKGEKKHREQQIKEIKLRPKVAEHDYQIKKNQAMSFLERGDRVKVSLQFRGREMAHQDIGMNIMKRMQTDLVGIIDSPPKLEGRQIIMMVRPKK